MRNRSQFYSRVVSTGLARCLAPMSSLLLVLVSAGLLGGCSAGGGHHGGGGGAANSLIDITSDVSVDNQPDSPNLTFTDGTNATLHFTISNSGNKPSDQLITVTVGLPNGITFVSFASVTQGSWNR
jgi:uncharacterized repeat protein (TIGR01451 family)